MCKPCADSCLRMHKITSALNETINSVTAIVHGDQYFVLRVSSFGDLAAFMAILAIFSLRMRRNGYLVVSGEILTPEFDSLTPIGNDISAICRRFLLIFAFDVLNVHQVYLTY